MSTRLQGVWREPREALRRWLSTHRSLRLLEDELDDSIARLLHQAESFESQLVDFGLARLPRSEAFRFFRQLVNYDESTLATVKPDKWSRLLSADDSVLRHSPSSVAAPCA